MIVWSYSIYGTNTEVYYKPMLENIRLAKLNNIKVVISTTDEYENMLNNYFKDFIHDFHLEVFSSKIYKQAAMLLRYLVLERIDSEYYFIKDSDSIVTDRELYIMNHWVLTSNENFIIIRDNPIHVSPILGGIFGFRNNAKHIFKDSLHETFSKLNFRFKYGQDQRWLSEKIYPYIINQSQVYSSYFHFWNEKLIIIGRVYNSNFIGAQSIGNINLNSKENEFLHLYANDLLCLPYIASLPKYLRRLIYGRVRPSLYLAFLLKLFKKIKC